LMLKPLNGPSSNQVVLHLLCQMPEVVILLPLWRINHKSWFLVDGLSHLNIPILWFMIFQKMNGLTLKSLIRSQNGTIKESYVIPFHHGNISSLEDPPDPLKKEENVPTPNLSMKPSSSTLMVSLMETTGPTLLLRLISDQNQEKPKLFSTIKISPMSLFMVVGKTTGSMICGAWTYQPSLVLLMPFLTWTQNSVHWLVRLKS